MFPSALANSRVRGLSGGRTPGSAPESARSFAISIIICIGYIAVSFYLLGIVPLLGLTLVDL
jgi:hypothetical protein